MRGLTEAAVRRELVGPLPGEQPRGRPLDISARPVRFASVDEARGLWHDVASGQEILSEINPLRGR